MKNIIIGSLVVIVGYLIFSPTPSEANYTTMNNNSDETMTQSQKSQEQKNEDNGTTPILNAIIANDLENNSIENSYETNEAYENNQTYKNNQTTVYYANCDAVRQAGVDPIYFGDPGYNDSLDRDGDGVACEQY